jgi:hypothetical protein
MDIMIAPIGKLLIGAGLFLLAAGLVVLLLGKFGIARLPGDIVMQRGRVTVFFPIVTCLVLSLVFSLLISLIARWRH